MRSCCYRKTIKIGSMSIHLLSTVVLSLLLLFLTGCSTLGYYAQSIHGHLDLMGRSQPIDQLLADPDTDTTLGQRLARVREMRDFASAQLQLPDNDSYRNYADLDRPAVVWSVVATPEFSMEARRWCYPFVGCAAYRGYFSRQQADLYAAELKASGLDVAVEAVPAYSTLGWFDDPLPSTVIDWAEHRLAGLIFHELAHQQLYVKGDSAFNEAFASTVERVGVERWLDVESDPAGRLEWAASQQRQRAFITLLLESRQRLIELYALELPMEEKRRRKQGEFGRLRAEYDDLKISWNGISGFDHWFRREVNNARLASVATYEYWVEPLLGLLGQSNGDLGRFYQACGKLGQLPEGERRRRLEQLVDLE